jgi:hypothetical protein
LLLTVHGYEIPTHAVDSAFYRQALDLDLRSKREYTEAILSAMGGVNRARFSQYKALLQLTDEALELADRHDVDEFRLRPILKLPSEAQAEMVQHILQFNLSGRQVSDICERGFDGEVDPDPDFASPHIRQFVKSMMRIGGNDEDDFIQSLLHEEQSQTMALARVESVITFLMRVKSRISD